MTETQAGFPSHTSASCRLTTKSSVSDELTQGDEGVSLKARPLPVYPVAYSACLLLLRFPPHISGLSLSFGSLFFICIAGDETQDLV